MSFLKYSVQTFAVRVALMCLGIVAGIVNARWLGLEGVGILALLRLMIDSAFRFGNLGFGSAFAFFVARKQTTLATVRRQVWGVGLGMSAITCLILVVTRRHQAVPWHDIKAELVFLALLAVPMMFINSFLGRILSGQLRITVVNLSEAINTLVYVPLVLTCVVFLEMGVIGALLALLIAQLASVAFLVFQLPRGRKETAGMVQNPTSQPARISSLWRYGRWSYLNLLVRFLFEECPLYCVKYFSSNQGVGIFSVARNLSRRSRLVTEPFSMMLFPFTAASGSAAATQRTNLLCRITLPMMLLLLPLLAVLARPLIVLLYGEAFAPAAIVFVAILPTIALFPLMQFLGVHVAASGSPKVTFVTGFAGLVAAAVMCPILIPAYGAVGAGISASGIYFTVAAFRLVAYTQSTDTRLRDVLVPRGSDIVYCQKAMGSLFAATFGPRRA